VASSLRILCWNIAEGRIGKDALNQIAAHIRRKSPDLVLLNEAKKDGWWWPRALDHARDISRKTGLRHYAFGGVNGTGITGHKGVAVISRYPLGASRMHPVIHNRKKTGFGTLATSITIDGQIHHILSTRFAPHNTQQNREENPVAIHQAFDLVNSFDSGSPLIFGGDFNASTNPGTQEYESVMKRFLKESGLTEVLSNGPDDHGPDDRVDYLFYRGEYRVSEVEFLKPQPEVSDHPWIFAVLER
jgi:endonuclease/exonuclease/phosphatase family metal-dependent hydrolase